MAKAPCPVNCGLPKNPDFSCRRPPCPLCSPDPHRYSRSMSDDPSNQARKGPKRFGGKAFKGRGGRPLNTARRPLVTDSPDGVLRLYGLHTVRAALDNPARALTKLLATLNGLARLDIPVDGPFPCPVEVVSVKDLDRLLGADAVHQGVVLETEPLRPLDFRALADDARMVLVLDQVTDPHNVGALMRSAVAFGATALITTSRHSPSETGVLAKSASGALEHLSHIEVRNLAEAIEALNDQGFQTIGLDSEGPEHLEKTVASGRIALVLGAEGKGLRQKTRSLCSNLARLDMPGAIRSLNVSNAGAIALYVVDRHLGGL